MQTHIGKAIRMSDIQNSKSFLFDTTIASSIGAPPNMENLKSVLQKCNGILDGIIVNPGQMEHLSSELSGKNRAAPLVRVDWTNAYRDKHFCLPVSNVKRVEISQAEDVMDIGGAAAVITYLMGYGDEFEAQNVRSISKMIRASYTLSLPVFVDIRPIGPGVSEINFEDSIKLGVSFMMEAGADALIVPYCSNETLKLLGSWSTIPVIVRIEELISRQEAEQYFDLKIAGILFSEKLLEMVDYTEKITQIRRKK